VKLSLDLDILGENYLLPFKIAGKTLDPSDLRMRLDVSIRDNKTITRKIVKIKIKQQQDREL
jgi:hypothetical protein